MEILTWLLQILAFVLLIIGIIYRKKPWGVRMIFFALGMIVVFFFTDWLGGIVGGFKEMAS